MKKKIVLMLVAVGLMASSAMALVVAPNLVGDSHFNQLDVSGTSVEGFTGFWRYGSIDNWDSGTGTGTEWATTWYGAVVNGPSARAAAWGDYFPSAGSDGDDQYATSWYGHIGQLVDGFVSGQEYDVSMYIASASAIDVQIWVGGEILPNQTTNFEDTDADGDDEWELHTWTFVASVDGASLMYLYTPGNTVGFFDDVSVVAVPEPMTMALLGLGGLFLRRKKR